MWRKRYFTLAIEIDKLFFCLKIAKKCNKKSFRTPTQWRRFENWLSIVNEVRIILQQPYWSRNRFLCNCCHIKSKWKRNIIYIFLPWNKMAFILLWKWFIQIQKYLMQKYISLACISEQLLKRFSMLLRTILDIFQSNIFANAKYRSLTRFLPISIELVFYFDIFERFVFTYSGFCLHHTER